MKKKIFCISLKEIQEMEFERVLTFELPPETTAVIIITGNTILNVFSVNNNNMLYSILSKNEIINPDNGFLISNILLYYKGVIDALNDEF